MTPRRKETNLDGGQSVRFYKIVALSFLFLTIILLAVIVFMSSKRATITVITKPEPVEVNSTLEINEEDGNGLVEIAEVKLSQAFKPQSTKEDISLAIGVVTLHNEKEYAQPLIATTRLLSPDGVLFRLKDRVVIPASGTVEAEVYADEEGKDSEIGPTKFTIPGLREDTQAYIYATSAETMKGGIRTYGVLTSSDLKKAEEELLASMQKVGQEKLSKQFPEKSGVFAIVDSKIDSNVKLDEEIEEFELSGEATVIGVFYNQEEIVNQAKKDLAKRVVGNVEKISTGDVEPTVVLGDYDLKKQTAVLNLFCTGLVELDPESQQLEKMIFFGKSKDEVRRYLLSLDHVQGVEIKFSPAWMMTVPHVSEHVNVVVKKVE